MADTYSQLYIHFVFTVKDRACLISPEWRRRLFQYIAGIIEKCGHKVLAVNGTGDHVHILIGLNPAQSISNLMQIVKKESALWINNNHFISSSFHWQSGYGAFSYSRSHIEKVIKYIMNQEEHHKKRAFKEEYMQLLKHFEIKYEEKYLFDWIDNE